ncbi:Cytochrome c oxidase subunit 7C, mitochondrial [Sorochytrium milnesiophthora]
MLRSAALRSRSAATQLARSGFNPSNAGYKNIPFDVHNKPKLATYMILYLGAGFAAPFFGKKNGVI